MQASYDMADLQAEIDDLSEVTSQLRQKVIDAEMALQIAKIEQKAAEENNQELLKQCSPEQKRDLQERIYELEQELEELKWKVTGAEIHKIELMNAKDVAIREAEQTKM